jgi:hypothetical protein
MNSTTQQELQSRIAELRGLLAQAEAELAAWPEMPTTGKLLPDGGLEGNTFP